MSHTTRHGRPTAPGMERPRGYPTPAIPDITPAPTKPTPNGLLPSSGSFLIVTILIFCVILPAYF